MQKELDRMIKDEIEKIPTVELPSMWMRLLRDNEKGLSRYKFLQNGNVTWSHCDELVDGWMDKWDAGDKSFEKGGMATGNGSG